MHRPYKKTDNQHRYVPNYFESSYSKFDGQFQVDSFHFHAHSEHTIEGKQYDFEMHTVHFPSEANDKYIAGVMGVIFDMYYYNETVTDGQVEIIDAFFDSLNMDSLSNGQPAVDVTGVPYGEFMNMIESDSRWVYKGSLTTPPCSETIYWNVVSKVYPIKPRHLDAFVNLLKSTDKATRKIIPDKGNYREI